MKEVIRLLGRNVRWFYLTGLVAVTMTWASPSESRTWYVKADGTGDAPTIQAAIDSTVVSDVVLVGAGKYVIGEYILMKEGITLTSESGPSETQIVPGPGIAPSWGISATGRHNRGLAMTVTGFWIHGFSEGMLFWDDWGPVNITNNVFTDNLTGLNMDVVVNPWIRNNTFYGNTSEYLDEVIGGDVQFNIFWDRFWNLDSQLLVSHNDMMFLEDAEDPTLNFSQDPQFCGPTGGNFFLQSDSPCARGNSPWPQLPLIGALPVGCSEVPTASRTWGSIKEMYRTD